MRHPAHHPSSLLAAALGLFIAGGLLMQPSPSLLVAASTQDATYSIPGKPQPVDEEAATPGVGFDQAGGEMNPYASEGSAINPVQYHFHFYGHQGSAAPGQSGEVAGTPDAPAAPAGYARPVWSVPMALDGENGGGRGWGGGYHFHFYGHGNYGMPLSQHNATGAATGFDQGAGRGNYGLPASQGNATGAGAGSAGGANYHFHFYGPPMGNPGPRGVPQGNPGGFAP
jgi:hypothetical protein